MEDTLGVPKDNYVSVSLSLVLILVLMEDTLGALREQLRGFRGKVLILVLMEDTLGELRLIFLCLSLFEVYLLLAERFG